MAANRKGRAKTCMQRTAQLTQAPSIYLVECHATVVCWANCRVYNAQLQAPLVLFDDLCVVSLQWVTTLVSALPHSCKESTLT